ncbi:hypothetical protein ACWEOO_06385 [Kribbella sp. NPDC004138]
MTYAGYLDPITQSGHVMRGYKNPAIPKGSHWQTVALLAALGLVGHVACPGRLLGVPISAWATVPSLPPKRHPAVHPLNEMVSQLTRVGAQEVVLTANPLATSPRAIDADHFAVSDNSAEGHHVLLIDDTWTSGGHVTSAALALQAGRASHVSVLVLARWLALGWQATTIGWAKERLAGRDFQPEICPWTHGHCP